VLSPVILIQGASQAVVLSDIRTAATEGAGKLSAVFARQDADDRDPFSAMRPTTTILGRKIFGAAELFTGGCGELPGALLAAGGIPLETVSDAELFSVACGELPRALLAAG